MTTEVDASSAPIECVIAGKTLRMSPLTQDDKVEFTRWLQSEVMRSVRESFTAEMTEAEKARWRSEAIREAQGVSMASKQGMAKIATQEGLARLLCLGFRHNHAGMKWQEVGDLLDAEAKTKADEIEAMISAFDLLNLPAEDEKKKPPAMEPTPTPTPDPVLTT